MQDYIYSALSFVAIAIHLIINFDKLFGRGVVTKAALRYRGFLASILAYYITDVAWGMFAGLGWTRALYYDTVLYFLALAFEVLYWCRFVISYLNLSGRESRILQFVGYSLLVLNIVALTANFFNDCFFYFDAKGDYTVGYMRNIVFILQLALNILAAVFSLSKVVSSHGVARRRNMLVVLFGLTMTVAFAMQVIWPLLPFTALGCLIGNCFFHIYVVEDELDELRKAVIEREQAEKHLAELEQALERARAAEKSRTTFFSIVSHDIRTPLNAILGYSELLQNGISEKSERDEALKSINASGKTLLQLVNDVLDFAKMDSGMMTLSYAPVDIAKLTSEVFVSFGMSASAKGIELKNNVRGLPPVLLDERRFRQIMFNLIGNAVKFTERGYVAVGATCRGGSLKVSVEDTGCGIEPELMAKIFDPFVTQSDILHSKARATGTGLGLPICKKLAKIMGGEITVESEKGMGTKFTFVMNGVNTAAAAPEATNELEFLSVPPAKLPKHVLVVDDSSMNRLVLKAFLKRVGVETVDYACDGVEAFDILSREANSSSAIDFVFTDFWMPNMNGVELVEKIRADSRFGEIPVFAVTADTEMQTDERAKFFSGILFKPFTYGKLVETLSR